MTVTSHTPANIVVWAVWMPWLMTSSRRSSVGLIITAAIRARPEGISYDTICATARMDPSRENLLLDPQPAINKPMASTDTMAMTKKSPRYRPDGAMPGAQGITAKPRTTATKIMTGAAAKSTLSEIGRAHV